MRVRCREFAGSQPFLFVLLASFSLLFVILRRFIIERLRYNPPRLHAELLRACKLSRYQELKEGEDSSDCNSPEYLPVSSFV